MKGFSCLISWALCPLYFFNGIFKKILCIWEKITFKYIYEIIICENDQPRSTDTAIVRRAKEETLINSITEKYFKIEFFGFSKFQQNK